MYKFFIKNSNKEYICGSKLSENEKYLPKVIRYWWYDIPIKQTFLLRCVRKGINMVLNLLPKRVSYIDINRKRCDVYYGYAYWVISMECARFVLKVLQNNKKLYWYFLFSYAPIELYPHTIIFNSKYGAKAVRIKKYGEADCMAYAPLHYVSYGINGSNILVEEDFEILKKSSKLFCQKVDSLISKDLIKKLRK